MHPLKSSPTVPNLDDIESMLRSCQPTPAPGLSQRVARATWARPATKVNFWQIPAWRYGMAVVVVLLAFSFGLLTPAGRSLADSISQFFQFAPAPQATEIVSSTPLPTADPGYPYNQYLLTPEQAQAAAGFTVQTLDGLPENWVLQGARYDAEWQRVSLFYSLPSADSSPEQRMENAYLYVYQQKGEFENFFLDSCPNGTFQKVMVNANEAEFTDGAIWVTYTEPTPGIEREWVCERTEPGSVMTLRWQEGDLKYEINLTQFVEDASLRLTGPDLIHLAEAMRPLD